MNAHLLEARQPSSVLNRFDRPRVHAAPRHRGPRSRSATPAGFPSDRWRRRDAQPPPPIGSSSLAASMAAVALAAASQADRPARGHVTRPVRPGPSRQDPRWAGPTRGAPTCRRGRTIPKRDGQLIEGSNVTSPGREHGAWNVMTRKLPQCLSSPSDYLRPSSFWHPRDVSYAGGVEPIVVEATRGDVVEARHRVHAVAVSDGRSSSARAIRRSSRYFRSSAKPIQALPIVRARPDLDDAEIAIACASHLHRPDQLEPVRTLLAKAAATEDDLECGPEPTRLEHNCSGKHAAMLLLCRERDWPTEGYRLASHPCQQAMLTEISRAAESSPTRCRPPSTGAES